jgi:hypothetical protein
VHGAARSDIGKALSVVERLETAGLKPETLFADGGYPSVPSALKVIEQEIEFIAPVNRSRLSDEVVGRDLFQFDSEGFAIRCPMGHRPIDHRILSGNNTTRRSLHAIFDGDTCRSCNVLDQCPVRTPNHRSRGCHPRDTVGDFRLEITREIRLRDQMYATQQTTEWKDRYKIRSGIEATNSELKRSHGMGKLRVRRAAKVCFVVACKVIACNIKRWAKAHTALERAFPGLEWTISARLREFQDRLIKISLFLRITWVPQLQQIHLFKTGTYFSGIIISWTSPRSRQVEFRRLACYQSHSFKGRLAAVAQVIDHNGFVTAQKQFDAGMGSYVPGATGDQHGIHVLISASRRL